MKQASQLNAIQKSLNAAIAQENWTAAATNMRKIIVALINATIENDEERISYLNHLLDNVYDDLVYAVEAPLTLDVTSFLWKTESVRDVAQIARASRPTLSPAARERRLKDARSQILQLLSDGNSQPRSNLEIAELTGLHVATVARTLVALRAEKIVKSWPEGAKMMNCVESSEQILRNFASRPTKQAVELISQDKPKESMKIQIISQLERNTLENKPEAFSLKSDNQKNLSSNLSVALMNSRFMEPAE
jgi:hypothetical protein